MCFEAVLANKAPLIISSSALCVALYNDFTFLFSGIRNY